MMMRRLLFLFLFLSTHCNNVANAFHASLSPFGAVRTSPWSSSAGTTATTSSSSSSPSSWTAYTTSTTARFVIMTEDEIAAILQSAESCAEGECSIEDVGELIVELREQETILSQRLEDIMNMIAHLQHVNEKESRQTDEVRAFVKDMLRVFAHEKGPVFSPSGFTGDYSGKTAYDALPPKKWINKSNKPTAGAK